jgi:hypothetical protein
MALETQEGRFEGHITLAPGSAEAAKKVLYAWPQFHLSEIAGDEVMGDGRWVYVTTSGPDPFDMLDRMDEIRHSLECAGIKVVRKKVEAILLDERFNNGTAREAS